VFESAADAVIAGDTAALERMLRENPKLIRERSTRFHESTLLHYVAANGVEDFRQKTPKNAVDVAKLLIKAGAEVDAENNPGRGTTLGLVATSFHPAKAKVQIALLETLLAAGASVDGLSGGWNPLVAALHNGRGEAAAYLAQRGARLDLEGAAGAGRLDALRAFVHDDGSLGNGASEKQRDAGFLWACEYGHADVVEFLLERGLDPGLLRGCTGLHWAAYCAHTDVIRVLLARNAPINARDADFEGTPLGWALYAWCDPPAEIDGRGYVETVKLLVDAGGTERKEWLSHPNRERSILTKIEADSAMKAAVRGALT